MSDTDNPTKKSFVAELDAAVQKVKSSLETRLEYMTFELAMQEREETGSFKERIELVKNFFANGTPIKIISKSTGLTEEEISKILADNTNTPKNSAEV